MLLRDYNFWVCFRVDRSKYRGDYYSDYNPNCAKPFINKICLTINNLLDINYIDVNDLPKRNDQIYIEIERFPDYDYLNSVAYEMLIRTKEYDDILKNFENYNRNENIKKCEQLGIDVDDVLSLKRNLYNHQENKINFSNFYFNMTLKDIENGLDTLIKFYLNKKQIYIIDNENIYYPNKNHKNSKGIILSRTFKISSNITFKDIKSNLSKYYIPAKYDYQTPENKNKSVLDINIPLVTLEPDFLIFIENLIPNRIKGIIDFNFTRPLLRFKESPIVDVPINLNLLNQLINKLKDDFEDGSIKNPINILYDIKYKFEKLENLVPFKMTKQSISESFFVYDLYQKINFAVILHKVKLEYLRELDLKELENCIKRDLEQEKNKINEIINGIKQKDNEKDLKFININKRELRKIKRKFDKTKKEEIININKQYKEYSKEYNVNIIWTSSRSQH